MLCLFCSVQFYLSECRSHWDADRSLCCAKGSVLDTWEDTRLLCTHYCEHEGVPQGCYAYRYQQEVRKHIPPLYSSDCYPQPASESCCWRGVVCVKHFSKIYHFFGRLFFRRHYPAYLLSYSGEDPDNRLYVYATRSWIWWVWYMHVSHPFTFLLVLIKLLSILLQVVERYKFWCEVIYTSNPHYICFYYSFCASAYKQLSYLLSAGCLVLWPKVLKLAWRTFATSLQNVTPCNLATKPLSVFRLPYPSSRQPNSDGLPWPILHCAACDWHAVLAEINVTTRW